MQEDIPAEVAVPLAVILWAAFLFQRRHALAAWLGLKEKK